MMKLGEIKKMLKEDFNEKYLYNLRRIDIEKEVTTFGIVNVKMSTNFREYVVGTFKVWDNELKLDEKKMDKVEQYVKKLVKSFRDVEEMDDYVDGEQQ